MSTILDAEEIFSMGDQCEIPPCERSVYSVGYCNLHYQRNRKLIAKGVKPSRFWPQWWEAMNKPPPLSRVNPDGRSYKCSYDKCLRGVYAKGFCQNHYMKRRREM